MNPLINKAVETWTMDEVCEWLTEAKLPSSTALDRVQEKMKVQDVNGYILLKYTVESLIQDGHSRGCAIMLSEAIEKLKLTQQQRAKPPSSNANSSIQQNALPSAVVESTSAASSTSPPTETATTTTTTATASTMTTTTKPISDLRASAAALTPHDLKFSSDTSGRRSPKESARTIRVSGELDGRMLIAAMIHSVFVCLLACLMGCFWLFVLLCLHCLFSFHVMAIFSFF
jgi:hypothetical protein